MSYLNVKEFSIKWDMSESLVRRYCKLHKIEGAIQKDGAWLIPSNATRPARTVHKQPSQDLTPLAKKLSKQKQKRIRSGIYGYAQTNLTYSNNRLASNRLTRNQVEMLFRKDKVYESFEPIKVSDIIDTINHFMCLDYIIDTPNNRLSQAYIKKLHYLLKFASYDDRRMVYTPGEYRHGAYSSRPFKTASARTIDKSMTQLLSHYESLETVTLSDLLDFHVQFEKIHPFDDANGRVGRLILFKECLRHNICPFIIQDKKREQYQEGIAKWSSDPSILVALCKSEQDRFLSEVDFQKLKETHISFQ